MKKIISLAILLAIALTSAHAQVTDLEERMNQKQQSFDEYIKQQQDRFNDYIQKQSEEFDKYLEKMSKKWDDYAVKKGLTMPTSPEPKVQPVKPAAPAPQPNAPKPAAKPLPVAETPAHSPKPQPQPKPTPAPAPAPKPQPSPTPAPESTERENFRFSFFQTPCAVAMGKGYLFTLPSVKESTCADAWKKLSKLPSTALIQDLTKIKSKLNLGDWGYIKLVGALGDAFYTDRNASTLFQMFVLAQSGYKVRIGRCDGRLCLLLPFDSPVYSYSYIEIGGEKYYMLSEKGGSCAVFNMAFEGESTPSLRQKGSPKLNFAAAKERQLDFQGESIRLKPNKNVVDFYAAYPLNDAWNYYAGASISPEMKEALYPFLKKKLAKAKTNTEAVNTLLAFVQKSFAYKTDGDQFGYERPLFCEESFYFPYNDCEDRSILFSNLVRELLGLDVVLLSYKGHISTAVRLNEDTSGHYFNIKGHRYYSCDPTYIGSIAGDVMPEFINARPVIVDN